MGLRVKNHSLRRGQSSLEYLLLLAVVAVVVIAAFGKGALIDQLHNTAGDYYNSVTKVIMDSDNTTRTLPNGELVSSDTPNPIAGGWCPVTCPAAGSFGFNMMYGACECPPPAFGGAYCPSGTVSCAAGATCRGEIVQCGSGGNIGPCGPCPTGQVCLPPDGHCGCSNGLSCGGTNGSPGGSIPNTSCSSCICPSGMPYNSNTKSCENYCPISCTTFNGTNCSPVSCGANQTCDPTQPNNQECACDKYSYWDGSACVYCGAINGQCTTPSADGKSCVPIAGCATNSYCNTTDNACECDAGTYWKGNSCVSGSCKPTTTCPSGPSACGKDSCGGNCGANSGGCPAGEKCNSTSGPGTCETACLACQTWNGTACVSTTPCGSNDCGVDSCGNSCGKCSLGKSCSSSTNPGICS